MLLAVLLIGFAIWVYGVMSKPEEKVKRRSVQSIELLKPPPPPPPPPKTPPPPPPPPQQQEKIDVPKPEAPPEAPSQAPPPGPDLGVDAAGSGSGDGFGLVGKPGGSDLIGGSGAGGGSGGGGGDRFAWYGALVKERITDAIYNDKRLRAAADYQRNVNVWVNASGAITRVELVGQGESPALDEALRQALRSAGAVREGAPSDMPQPIRLRVSARS